MSLADYLDRHGWDDDPLTLAAEYRGGGGSPSQLRKPSSPRKGAGSLDPLDFPFAARLSNANVLFNEEYGVPVPPGSRALSSLPNASPSPNRLRSSEPLGSSMRLSSCSPDFLRQNEALGSRLSSPSRQRSQSVGGSSWPSQASPPMPSGVRPPVRPSAPTRLHDSLHLPSPRASRNLSPRIGTSGSPGSSRESSFRKDDRVTQHGATNALSSLDAEDGVHLPRHASFAPKLVTSPSEESALVWKDMMERFDGDGLEQKLESERRVLDKQLEKEALDWQQQQQPKPKKSWGLVMAAMQGSMQFKQGSADSKDAVSPGGLRSPPKGSPSAATTSSEQRRAATSSDEQRRVRRGGGGRRRTWLIYDT